MKEIKLLSPLDAPLHGVIDAELAAEILQMADLRQETADWITDQKTALEDEIASLRQEGVAQGIKEGLATFGHAIDAYRLARVELADRIRPILRACIGEILAASPRADILAACINSVLQTSPDESKITISVHATDKAAMLSAVDKINKSAGVLPKMIIHVSDEIAAGECVFYTEADVLNVDVHIMTDLLLEGLADPATLTKLKAGLLGAGT